MFTWAKCPKPLLSVLTKDEVHTVMQNLVGVERLAVQLLCGSRLRLAEALNLRVEHVDFAQSQLIVRDTKGDEDFVTPLPESI